MELCIKDQGRVTPQHDGLCARAHPFKNVEGPKVSTRVGAGDLDDGKISGGNDMHSDQSGKACTVDCP